MGVMQDKIAENIRYYRKQLGLTQEKLAEAMDVTVGAVSKWESGSTVPDIETLMRLANLFDISMDVLLGYGLSSSRVEDICNRINQLRSSHAFEKAEQEAKNALLRYPHHFRVIYTCAQMYSYKAWEKNDKDAAKKAISLLQSSLQCFSQNEDHSISEYSIRLAIGKLYQKIDPDKAFDILSNMNYEDPSTSRAIGNVLNNIGKKEKAMEFYSMALLHIFAEQGNTVCDITTSVIDTGNRTYIEKSIDLIDVELFIIESYRKGNAFSVLDKIKVTLLVNRAICCCYLNRMNERRQSLEKAYHIAENMNQVNLSDNAVSCIRFIFVEKEFIQINETLGNDVVAGIEKLLFERLQTASKKSAESIKKVIFDWQEMKNK